MTDVRELADAILHEGYLLYPYRPSALKNQHRYPFGTLYPRAFCESHQAGDTSSMRIECVALGPPEAQISGELRFLQFLNPAAAVRSVHLLPVSLGDLAETRRSKIDFSPLCGEASLRAFPVRDRTWKLCIDLSNLTPLAAAEKVTRDEALLFAMASTHLVLSARGGEFVSLIDPPDSVRDVAGSCRNVGLWPVLVGKPGTHEAVLAAPIILYDYPELAPESPGDFFDGTEIDAMLTLRVLTLTDEEKREMSDADGRARTLLERTEASGLERLVELHGRLRPGRELRPGLPVRLRPKGRADIFDLALADKRATIQAIERDLEGRTYVAVTVDDDPGKDLGAYGHRFFFRPEEVELL
jgi:hypothetical protein